MEQKNAVGDAPPPVFVALLGIASDHYLNRYEEGQVIVSFGFGQDAPAL